MSHRQSNIYLSVQEARCEPSGVCDRKDTCARYLAPIPTTGARIEDFNRSPIGLDWFKSPCQAWVSAQNKPLQQPPVIRRHPPLGSEP